jgi:uncharacterized surface protein with fasciclin (FAS1) repeats
VDNATVTSADIIASNGVSRVIDSVILPKRLQLESVAAERLQVGTA